MYYRYYLDYPLVNKSNKINTIPDSIYYLAIVLLFRTHLIKEEIRFRYPTTYLSSTEGLYSLGTEFSEQLSSYKEVIKYNLELKAF